MLYRDSLKEDSEVVYKKAEGRKDYDRKKTLQIKQK